jgi:hypothetical protein
MIRLEFDERRLAALADAGTAFDDVPVLLNVAGIDLLSRNADTDGATVSQGLGLALPLIARWGLIALRQAPRDGMSACELDQHGGALLFASRDEDLLVHSMLREKTVQVRYARMLEAWERFDARVRTALVRTFAPLDVKPWWNAEMDAWVKGRTPADIPQPTPTSLHYLSVRGDAFDRLDAVDS